MIEFDGVFKSFGNVKVLEGINLHIETGDQVSLGGDSGCGKTTLLRLLAGLEAPDDGEIRLDGQLASKAGQVLVPPHRRRIGMVFQSPNLWPHLTVTQNILFGMDGQPKKETSQRLALLLEKLELGAVPRRYPAQLSGGQARRVALARALAPKPAILLFDEPLVNLQPELKTYLAGFVVEWARDSQATVVYVTHEPDEAGMINGKHYWMENHQVIEKR